MLRFIGAILFGGGVCGAFAGWALVTYLDNRRRRVVARVTAACSVPSPRRPATPKPTMWNAPGAIVEIPPDIKPQDFIDQMRPHLHTDPTVWKVSEAERRQIEDDPKVRAWYESMRQHHEYINEILQQVEEEMRRERGGDEPRGS